jgi:hypothetical protein
MRRVALLQAASSAASTLNDSFTDLTGFVPDAGKTRVYTVSRT